MEDEKTKLPQLIEEIIMGQYCSRGHQKYEVSIKVLPSRIAEAPDIYHVTIKTKELSISVIIPGELLEDKLKEE